MAFLFRQTPMQNFSFLNFIFRLIEDTSVFRYLLDLYLQVITYILGIYVISICILIHFIDIIKIIKEALKAIPQINAESGISILWIKFKSIVKNHYYLIIPNSKGCYSIYILIITGVVTTHFLDFWCLMSSLDQAFHQNRRSTVIFRFNIQSKLQNQSSYLDFKAALFLIHYCNVP